MIDGTLVVSWIAAVVMTILVGTGMYISMLDAFYEQPSIKHGRFWLCQGIAAFVALCIYLTRIGVIIWQ
jgi:Ni,Fe-hydrogenase I cytochrome b subunit